MNVKKFKTIAIVAVLTTSLFSMNSFAFANEGETPKSERSVQLSDDQKEELAELHMELMETRKELIEKYVEFGVFSEEKGKEMIERMEKKYEKLKENDFIPRLHFNKGMPRKKNEEE